MNIMTEEMRRYQQECSAQVREIMEIRARGPKPLASVHVFGCQQNVADAERMKGMLAEMGYGFTANDEEADLILFNTCAVREHAEDRVFGNVGALKSIKRRHPSTLIALCGCMAQEPHVAKKLKESYPFVGLVFGTHNVHRLPELLLESLLYGRRVFACEDSVGEVHEGIPVHRDGTIRAWLPVMYGCNNFCTYCIVPYVRGRERSRTPDMVLAEARDIVENGFKDITLLGQNVNSYGKNLPEPMSFAQLLKQTADIPGDFWVRFMTSHPKDATQELFDAMASSDKICKHLHLPFQSGSDRILKKMNRHYDRAKYLELVKAARKAMPDISLTSDVIVGFPGETREDFEETLRLVKEVEFTSLYTFIYSPREGTPAAKMEDPISAAEKSAWFTELCKVQEEIAARRCAKMVGSTVKVLCEQRSDKGIVSGRTEGNLVITFPAEETVVGSFAEVKITSARNWTLQGELVKMY
jgi:tRNA-2-methylthio-N6-dimethylallyladenosine synthase